MLPRYQISSHHSRPLDYISEVGYCHNVSSVCPLSSISRLWRECIVTQRLKLRPRGFHCKNFRTVSLTTKFQGDFLGQKLELKLSGFRVCSAILRNGDRWSWVTITWFIGRTPVSGQRSLAVLRSTSSWWVTTYVGKLSAIGQPTRPTQPFILSGR